MIVETITRSNYHLNLAGLIRMLDKAPAQLDVWAKPPHRMDGWPIGTRPGQRALFQSYRGYYEDLAICRADDDQPVKASVLYQAAKDALGQMFMGYKGGQYTAEDDTLLWVGEWGQPSGLAVLKTGHYVDEDEGRLVLVVLDTAFDPAGSDPTIPGGAREIIGTWLDGLDDDDKNSRFAVLLQLLYNGQPVSRVELHRLYDLFKDRPRLDPLVISALTLVHDDMERTR